MYCLKCGNETQGEQVFCEACLQAMEQYPIKPGTAIYLPRQDAPTAPKKPAHAKRAPTPEEQIQSLKKLLRWTMLLLFIAVAILGLAVAQLLHIF